MNYKILFTFIFIIQLFPFQMTSATVNESNNVEDFEVILVEEDWMDGRIVRVYRLNDDSTRTIEILVPEEVLSLIETSEDKPLEAKKILHHQYTILNLEKRAKEILNEYTPHFIDDAELKISEEIKKSFENENSIIQNYTKNEIQNGNTASLLKGEIKDYTIIFNTSFTKAEPVEAPHSPNWGLISISIIGGLLLICFMIFFIKRRLKP